MAKQKYERKLHKNIENDIWGQRIIRNATLRYNKLLS